jgi:predicted kinase
VRGKVTSFQLDEHEIPEEQRRSAQVMASDFFHLAQVYANGPISPTVMMIGGLMGTGKSTLANMVQQELGWSLFSSDVTRKHLAHLDERKPQPYSFGEGLYSAAWTQRTYKALQTVATETLSRSLSVLLDATFLRRADRMKMIQAAQRAGAQVIFVECRCDHTITLERLAHRWSQHTESKSDGDASQASDGRPELYDQQQKVWEAFDTTMEPGCHHLIIRMDQPVAIVLEQVLTALHYPRLVCALPLLETNG